MGNRERTDNDAHIFGLGDSVNHRKETDDKNVEFEVPMEYRSGCVLHTVDSWKYRAGI